jgi:septal ring factor EnvC (AmiA/AmiB activator)
MKKGFIILLLVIFFQSLTGQTRKDLEEQRKKTLEDIGYVDNLLKETAKEKSTGLDQLRIIGNKLNLRENVISGMREEINLINQRIELNKLAIEMMDKDLVLMKRDYAKTIVNSYKARKGNPEIGFILSSRDFNQGYKRLKYLQQVTKFRHQETEIILELQQQIEKSKDRLQVDLDNISDLKSNEESQKKLLQQEQDRKKRIVQTFSNKERQLKKDLEEKKKLAQKIEAEISKIIEEERKKRISTDLTPEQKLIGENFAENKGRLPWPVEKGIVTSQFGVQQHPVLANVTENNIGIEITSSGNTIARSVFKGQVMRVFPISGENMAIIIRHGKYLSVYLNLKNVRVKQGDNVEVKQAIGEIFCDTENGLKSVLKFMIFDVDDKKYLNPESWITKRSGNL